MKSFFSHIQVNIEPENINFYKELFQFLKWKTLFEENSTIGLKGAEGGSIWFLPKTDENKNNYDATGVNHIGLEVSSVKEVDEAAEFLKNKGITLLFDTPKYRPEFSGDDRHYYQIMFESPDKILFEILYSGPK